MAVKNIKLTIWNEFRHEKMEERCPCFEPLMPFKK